MILEDNITLMDNVSNMIEQETGQGVIICNHEGKIISATEKSRIGNIHEGSKRILRGEAEEIAITQELAEDLRKKGMDVRAGYNYVIKYKGERVGSIGITGEPQVVQLAVRIAAKSTEIFLINMFKEKELRYLSMHDQLTGVYNRAFFEEEMNRLSKSREYPISIIVGDLDGLKLINDNKGHSKGDEILKACAKVLRSSLRTSDILCRIGGDEFAIILPKTDRITGEIIAKRIRLNCDAYRDSNLGLGISIGVATAESEEDILKETFNKADKGMYQEKNICKKHRSNKNVMMQL